MNIRKLLKHRWKSSLMILFLLIILTKSNELLVHAEQTVHTLDYTEYSDKKPSDSDVLDQIIEKEKCEKTDITIVNTIKNEAVYSVEFNYNVKDDSGSDYTIIAVDLTKVTDIDNYINIEVQKLFNYPVTVTNFFIKYTTYQITYTLFYESPDSKKSVGEYFNTDYTVSDTKAQLSDIDLYIQGYRVSYLLEDGGEFYIPSNAIDRFIGADDTDIPSIIEINPKHNFYNLDYKTNRKIGSIIGKIKKVKYYGDTYFEIHGIRYQKMTEVLEDWAKNIIFSKEDKAFYYGTKPSTDEKKLKNDVLYQFIKKVTKDCKTDKDKVKALHDAIVLRCHYDIKNYSYYNAKLSNNYNMTQTQAMALHMLNDKTGVCENYSRLMKECCDRLFIPCELITGNAGSGAHMWNKVFVNGKWYHLDVTFADYLNNSYNKASDIRRTYFLKSSYEFMGHHFWSGPDYKTPEFSKSWSEIDRNNIKTTEQLRKAAVYASYKCRNGKKQTYKFRITGSGVQTSCLYYVLSYGYVMSVYGGYSNGIIEITYNY